MSTTATRFSTAISLVFVVLAGLFVIGTQQASASGEVELDVVSSRADMASGGSSLVQAVVPPSGDSAALTVALDGNDVTPNFQAVPGNERKLRALLDLSGGGTVTATLPGHTTAKLLIVDHSVNGPILSGVRQTPFVCETPGGAISPSDCNTTIKVEYRYRLASGGGWVTVSSPAQIPDATLLKITTTVPTGDRPNGEVVPQAIRVETGTVNRANYKIGFLIDPANPSVPGIGWNGRLIYGFGGGCTGGFVQGPAGNDNNFLRLPDVLGGYATAGSSQNVFGTRCSDSVSAETVSMVKEHFIEAFGQPDFVLGKGGSGGAMAQQMIGDNFPGLLDGLQISNSFTDNAFPGNQLMDCRLINEFLASPEAAGWTTEQKRAVKGLARETACAVVYAAFGENFFDPGGSCPPELAANTVFDPNTNPGGTRCLVYDGNVNVYGKEGDGLTRRPVDNVGVQFGLEPLRSGVITVDQFLDLNDGVGGIRQYDGVSVPARSTATTEALRRAYDSGQLNEGGAGLASTPIIDNRNYSIETMDNGHQIIHALSMRERLLKANGDPDGNGSAGTQVIWTSPQSLDDSLQLLTMDRWLTGIENDTSSVSKREKVLNNRPETISGSPAAQDACFSNDTGSLIAQQTQTDDSGTCGTTFPSSSGPRIEAGQPLANDILKCQLKPIDQSEYGVALTGPQLARLQTIFPQGICDNSKPGIEQQISHKTWRALPTSATPDTTAPDTAISSSLRKRGQSGRVKLLFTSSQTGSSYECRFDSAAFTACVSPLERSTLPVGYHSFDVRATDIAGNTDPSPARAGFIVGYPKALLGTRSRLIKFNRRGRGYAKVRCTLTGMKSCYGRATLSVKGRVFGARKKAGKKDRRVTTRKYKVKAGARAIKLKLNGRTRRKLRQKGHLRAKIVFTVGQAGTSPKRVTRIVRLTDTR
ncbi:MAG: hypothetical protein JJE13_06900 [Thermoleophilia bacterium]|nr:hypothetical protein [Thermoleophilia bacterium]